MPPPKDPEKRKEWQRKLCEARRKRITTDETRAKLSASRQGEKHPMYGKKHTEESRKKMSEAHRNISDKTREKMRIARNNRAPASEETRRKMSEAHKGKNNHNYGKRLSKEQREKLREANSNPSEEMRQRSREANLGKHHTEETRKKMSIAQSGPNYPNWQGGISFEPYCPKFNNEFKERVRAFFEYRCVECGSSQAEEKLHVHHVTYNKKVCCDNSIPLFVPLCRNCHTKTNHNREYWYQHFTELIMTKYGGKCYLSKEEMEAINQ